MFKLAAAKFEKGSMVKLKGSINFWMNKKALVHYSKGHEFAVISSHISHKYEECHIAFEEDGDIINPEFFYELIDSDGHTLTAYEDILKRVKLESKLPQDEDEEDEPRTYEGTLLRQDQKAAKTQTPRKSLGFKPTLIQGKQD